MHSALKAPALPTVATVSPITVSEVQAAELLGISSRTLYEWRRQGIVPCIRIGSRILYSVDRLRAWAHEQSTFSTSEAHSA